MLLTSLVSLFYFSILSNAVTSAAAIPSTNDSRDLSALWGPYRPNVYFGMRARTPDSPLIGLMWGGVDGNDVKDKTFRHTCEQNDNMHGYGWTTYNPREGGIQVIHDADNNLDLSTEFLRPLTSHPDGSWKARIKGKPRNHSAGPHKSSIVLYIAMDNIQTGSIPNLICEKIDDSGVRCAGSTRQLESFKLYVEHSKSMSRANLNLTLRQVSAPASTYWQAKGTCALAPICS